MKGLNKFCMAVVLMTAALLMSCSSSQNTLSESNPNRKFVLENIPIHVRATATTVKPRGGRMLHLSGNENFIEVLNEKAFVDLPYWGRIYMPKYTTDGTSFAEPYTNLSVTRNAKDNCSKMKFKVSHESITYEVVLELWDGGNLDMSITPDNGEICFFSGYWDESQLYDRNGNPADKKFY